MMQRKAELQDGLTVEHILFESGCWASAVAYISAMSNTVKYRSTWGGFAEASVMAYHWNVRIAVCAMTASREELFLMFELVGPRNAEARVCLLWTGTHYVLLVLDDGAWTSACTPLKGR
jgi:hypothetical protein